MTAGMELDKLVGEKVMGWTFLNRRAMGWGAGPEVWQTNNEEAPTFQNFQPSTSIDCAWRVVSAMERYSCDFSLEKAGANNWVAAFGGASDHGDFAPLAICLAALKAVGAA